MSSRPQIETMHDLFNEALMARTLLERAWSPETQFQGITSGLDDVASRGQCGVASLWFARYLCRRGVEADFVEGITRLDGLNEECVWVEAQLLGEVAVADLTSDQYKTINRTKVHVGMYDSGPGAIGSYKPLMRFNPYEVPRRKLLARYAILEANIENLPSRYRRGISQQAT